MILVDLLSRLHIQWQWQPGILYRQIMLLRYHLGLQRLLWH